MASSGRLGDDEVGQILKRIASRVDRKVCAQVCRQWRRVEGQTRTKLRILDPRFLPSFLPRFRNLVTFEAGRGIGDSDLALVARHCPYLQVLNLNVSKSRDLMDLSFLEEYEYDDIGDDGVSAIAAGCRDLRCVTLRWRQGVGNTGVSALVNCCPNLTYLDFARCKRLTDQAVEAIGGDGCSLQALIVKGCVLVTDRGLASLATGTTALTLRRLDLSECDHVSDTGVTLLQHLSVLQALNLSQCGQRITDVGGVALASIKSLQNLNLSWLKNISDISILAVAENCRDLRELNVSGCELVTGFGVRAFSQHKALQGITLSACHNIFSEDVEQTAIECLTLEYLGVDRGLRRWIPAGSLHIIESRCRIEWL